MIAKERKHERPSHWIHDLDLRVCLGWILDLAGARSAQREPQESGGLTTKGMHVYLTGFMGAGKTTSGKLLADLLGRTFVDLDAIIESRQAMTIPEIFASHGEESFRQMESAALRSVDDTDPAVIATGGGILSRPGNREWMRAHGTAVWLHVPFEALIERLKGSELKLRPLFFDRGQVRALYESRLPEYGDSDLRIEVSSSHSAVVVAAMIRDILEDTECVI